MVFDPVHLLQAIILGVVEGLTEFLPISSTGHLILTQALIKFKSPVAEVFLIVIQAGAIFAVMWEYRKRITQTFAGLHKEKNAQQLLINLFIAFLPLAVLGLLFHKKIDQYLFSAVPVALSFIIGGILILVIEKWYKDKTPSIQEIDHLTPKLALKIGLAQALALIPGTSRSGATIMGSLMFGLSRQAATEFSFFLAMPTLLAASAYELFKERKLLSIDQLPMFLVGTIVSFISAFICVRWLLRYVSTHDFKIFAWYRIVFGVIVLLTWHFGWVPWTKQ